MAGVTFSTFTNSGTGALKNGLGAKVGFDLHYVNGVELTFTVDPVLRTQYSKFVVRQWLGPEAHWVKRGDSPLFSPWLKVTPPPPKTFDDSPDAGNVLDQGPAIVFYDNPGPFPYLPLYRDAMRIHVVQNFTAWIEGTKTGTGAIDNLVAAPAAWFSIIDIYVPDASNVIGGKRVWAFTPGLSQSGTGWSDVASSPPI